MRTFPITSELALRVGEEADGYRIEVVDPGGYDTTDRAAQWLVSQLASSTPALIDPTFHVQHLVRPPEVGPQIRGIAADQTNRSVVVGEQVVVKWLRRVADAEHPALRALTHLTEMGFTGVPTTYGALTWESPSGRRLPTAFASAFLPGSTDGWEWCVKAVEAGDSSFAGDLGRLAAGLHAALATPSSIIEGPGSVGAPTIRGWHDGARARLRSAIRATTILDDAPAGPEGTSPLRRASSVLGTTQARLEELIDGLLVVRGTGVQVVHGDLHVGQVLKWGGGLAVIDFDGNPVLGGDVLAPQPAARDLAQLLISLDQVGRIVDRRSGYSLTAAIDEWSATARAVLLTAYQSELALRQCSSLLDLRLLPAFMAEQACRDLVYSARFLPRWGYATIDGLASWLP